MPGARVLGALENNFWEINTTLRHCTPLDQPLTATQSHNLTSTSQMHFVKPKVDLIVALSVGWPSRKHFIAFRFLI